MAKVKVRSIPAGGFRRAGRLWGPDWTEAEVSADNLKLLQAEKMLAVEVLDDSPTAEEIAASQPAAVKATGKVSTKGPTKVSAGEQPTGDITKTPPEDR